MTPLNNLGTIDSARNRMEAARKEYEEAVKIYRELAEKNPENYLPEVSRQITCYSYGFVLGNAEKSGYPFYDRG